ncbi:MAG: DNA-directed RNA polymerase subunit omega [Pedosphaera sp.]|nr:DNA-directed RNA polymerase subunit omega [Pedosphaera sp.]
MKAEICYNALEKVGDPNLLINLISRRVRQLNTEGGTGSRPLIIPDVGMGLGDIALTELIEEKMSYELEEKPPEPKTKKKRRRS